MENIDDNDRNSSQLNFQKDLSVNIKHQRCILDCYLKSQRDKSRKFNKSDIYVLNNIKGLLSILNITLQDLCFINQQVLYSNFTILMQSLNMTIINSSEIIDIKEDSYFILFEGKILRNKSAQTHRPSYQFLELLIQDCKQQGEKKKQKEIFKRNSISRKSIQNRNVWNSKKQKSAFSHSTPKKRSAFAQLTVNHHKKPKKSSTCIFQISVSQNQSPILIDQKIKGINIMQHVISFESLIDQTVIFSFPRGAIEQFTMLINKESRQNISRLLIQSLGIESMRLINRILPKLVKTVYSAKHKFILSNKKIMLVYSGQILLENQYQILLRKNSVLWPQQNQSYNISVIKDNTLCIFLDFYHLYEFTLQTYPQLIPAIRNKIDYTISQRQSFFQKYIPRNTIRLDNSDSFNNYTQNYSYCDTNIYNKLSNRVFRDRPTSSHTFFNKSAKNQNHHINKQPNTQMTKLIGDELSLINFGHDYTQRRNNILSNPKLSNHKKDRCKNDQQRFRIFKGQSKSQKKGNQLFYDPENKPFMSLYPYARIMQSCEKVHEKKKLFNKYKKCSKKPQCSKQNTAPQNILEQRQFKEKKRNFYNEKVRKMKIKNIAARQIPNGHKKVFNVDGAEKQIAENSLMNPIIQYPVQGFNRDKNDHNILSKKSVTYLKQRKQKSPVFRKTDTILKKQSQYQQFLQNQNQQRKWISISNIKRNTMDAQQNSFSLKKNYKQLNIDFNKENQHQTKQKRPITCQTKKQQKDLTNKILICERIQTQM